MDSRVSIGGGGRRSRRVAAGVAAGLSGVLMVGGAVAAMAAPARTAAPTPTAASVVTVSGAAQFRAEGQTFSISLDVRGTAAGGSGRCALAGGGLAASCTGISSVTRGTGTASDTGTVVGTVRTSKGQNVAFRAVVTDRANPNGAGRDVISATVDRRTMQGTVSNGNLVVGGTTPTTTTTTPPTTTTTTTTANRAPVARNDTYTAAQDTALTIPAARGVLGNDTDPDGDPLAVGSFTQPTHGTLTLNPDGSFVYVPNQSYVGPDSFTYTASDGRSSSAPATVTITVESPAPQANPDTNTAAPGTSTTGNVLANDTPNLLVVKTPGEFDLASGTLTLYANGDYFYILKDASSRPSGDGNSDQVPYTAVDAQGRESSSTLTIFVPENAAN